LCQWPDSNPTGASRDDQPSRVPAMTRRLASLRLPGLSLLFPFVIEERGSDMAAHAAPSLRPVPRARPRVGGNGTRGVGAHDERAGTATASRHGATCGDGLATDRTRDSLRTLRTCRSAISGPAQSNLDRRPVPVVRVGPEGLVPLGHLCHPWRRSRGRARRRRHYLSLFTHLGDTSSSYLQDA
jgi:hypothetical protein